jgi:hypothetical protein
MEYSIVVSHGVASFMCLERWQNDQNAEESMPCTLSIKIKPDSRGLDPSNYLFRKTMDARVKPAHDESEIRAATIIQNHSAAFRAKTSPASSDRPALPARGSTPQSWLASTNHCRRGGGWPAFGVRHAARNCL